MYVGTEGRRFSIAVVRGVQLNDAISVQLERFVMALRMAANIKFRWPAPLILNLNLNIDACTRLSELEQLRNRRCGEFRFRGCSIAVASWRKE